MFQPVIGLEIHVELDTKSKMFCSCKNDSQERKPNTNICPVCMGHPGVLPVINEGAVRKVVKTGLALNCKIPEYSKFDRKNYFYPDLPKGYQISQYDMPIARSGALKFKIQNTTTAPPAAHQRKKTSNSKFKTVRIRRVHLEEDTGRLIHQKEHSLVDFNRAGIPLMELVTEPDIQSAKQARLFAEELQLILRYLGVSNADMEKGEMRVEANISLKRTKQKLGTKVEIKNLNSFRVLERAVEYEIERQGKLLNSGQKVTQETRGWDDKRGATFSQREKEQAHDYRYFPEPDLPPLHFTKDYVAKIRTEITELPSQKRERFEKEYKLLDKEIDFFVRNRDLGNYFEKIIDEVSVKFTRKELPKLIKLTANYLITDLQSLLEGLSVSDQRFLITSKNFASFIVLIFKGKISSKIAKIVLEEMFKTGDDPSKIIREKSLSLITDKSEIEKTVKEVLAKNQKAVEDFKKGKETAIQFLIGQVMAGTKGRADPKTVEKTLTEILAELK